MFYSDVIDMLCLYIQQSLFDLLQNSINELLCSLAYYLEVYKLTHLVCLHQPESPPDRPTMADPDILLGGHEAPRSSAKVFSIFYKKNGMFWSILMSKCASQRRSQDLISGRAQQ